MGYQVNTGGYIWADLPATFFHSNAATVTVAIHQQGLYMANCKMKHKVKATLCRHTLGLASSNEVFGSNLLMQSGGIILTRK
jgi:hypothetical protein